MDMASPKQVWRWLDRDGGHPPAEAISEAAFALVTARLRIRRRAWIVQVVTLLVAAAGAWVLLDEPSLTPDSGALVALTWFALAAVGCSALVAQGYVRRRDRAVPARAAVRRSVRTALLFLGPARVTLALLVLVAPVVAALGMRSTHIDTCE